MQKFSSDIFREELLRNFNEMLSTGNFDASWHTTIFQMLPKSGDLSPVTNWRPIAILSGMYKAFARLLYNRLAPTLVRFQSWDQHAFTPGIRIEDAIFCAEVASEYALEHRIPL